MSPYRFQLPYTITEITHWTGTTYNKKDCCVDWKVIEDYKKWCKENVGPNRWNYYGVYKRVPWVFIFKTPEDLLAFRLTFGYL